MSDEKFSIKGALKQVMDTQEFDSGFTKREFVIETLDDKYPQSIKMELIKDKTNLIDNFEESEVLLFHFNLRGNEYNGKFFVNVQCWKIEKLEGEKSGNSSKTKKTAKTEDENLDLPF